MRGLTLRQRSDILGMKFRKKNGGVVVFEDARGISGTNVDFTEEVVDLDKNKKRVRSAFHSTLVYLAAFLLTVTALYLSLAGTLLVAIPNTNNEDFSHTWVQRNKFAGGIPAPGQLIYASLDKEIDNSFFGKVSQTVSPPSNASILINVAGPLGDVYNEGEQIFFDGENTGFTGVVNSGNPFLLESEYLAKCYLGSCDVGSYYVIPAENLVGEPTHLLNVYPPKVEAIK